MNILLISHDFSVTGAPNSLLRQACYFRDAGHNVDVWSLGDGGLKPRYIEAGFNPIIVNNDYNDIKQQYEKTNKKYDFILCNTTVTYKAVDVLQRYQTPLVWFIRETKLVDEGIVENPGFANVFKNFYNIYTVSDYAANISRKYNKNVRVIRNAIIDSFKKFKKNGKKIVFGYIGSVISIKGVDILVRAFNKLSENNKNVELKIAGSVGGEYGEMLKSIAGSNIEFLGEIQKQAKQEFFDSIDILVVPSIDDPCPLTVIEGAMLGKPVITTDTVGSNFMIKNKQSGFIVKTGDEQDLYNAMSEICKMDLDKMKQISREMYLKYGTTERERKEVLKMLKDNENNLPVVKNELPKQPLLLPKWVVRLICCFIPNAVKRRTFRSEHTHPNSEYGKIFYTKIENNHKKFYIFGKRIFRLNISKRYEKTRLRYMREHPINLDNKNIVSLGMNCLPRTILTMWGLKHTKDQGELSYPFDLAVHYTKDLVDLLKNDFEDFCDKIYFNEQKREWQNSRYGFRYIHDEDILPNEREKLIIRLENRVKNWRDMIKDDKKTVFVLNLNTVEMQLSKSDAESIVKDMAKVIFKLRQNRETQMIVICPTNIDINIKNVFLCYAPFPWDGYMWHLSDKYTDGGIKYEQHIADFCYDILSK